MYKINEELVLGLIEYLKKQPYEYVAEGIKALESLEKIEEKKNEKA
jgi:hypothetical protein